MDGVTAAVDLQSRLLDAAWDGDPIIVRCALHTGAADRRDGDYFGPTLNRVARMLASAHGGQVLISQASPAKRARSPVSGESEQRRPAD